MLPLLAFSFESKSMYHPLINDEVRYILCCPPLKVSNVNIFLGIPCIFHVLSSWYVILVLFKGTNIIVPIQPRGSMYAIFTYIYHKNQLNVGKYTIHGSSGNISTFSSPSTRTSSSSLPVESQNHQ